MSEQARRFGTLKFFSAEKGYGFIKPDGGGRDVFFHKQDVLDSYDFARDQRLSYIMVDSINPKKGDGKKAAEVRSESANF